MRRIAYFALPLAAFFAVGCQKTAGTAQPNPTEAALPEPAREAAAPSAAPTPPPPRRYGAAEPLRVSRIEGAWLSQTRSPGGNGVCWAFYSAENTGDDRYHWGSIFDSDAAWLRHTDLDSAPVALLIYQNSHPVDVRAGDCVAVRYDGGKIVRIYPAPLAGTNGTFYVASDGSTYLDPELTRPAGAAPADRGHQE